MRAAAIAATLMLAGCSHAAPAPPTVEFPVLDDLPAETVKACPALPAVTGTLGDLSVKDASAAIEYARCQARAATAVGAYQAAQGLLKSAKDLADRQKAAAQK